jgi:hypothetical protein
MNEWQMRDAWSKFRGGNSLTDAELKSLIKQTEAAIPYLHARLPEYYLAYKETRADLSRLLDFQEARKPTRRTPQPKAT